jgi:hypothetical protein
MGKCERRPAGCDGAGRRCFARSKRDRSLMRMRSSTKTAPTSSTRDDPERSWREIVAPYAVLGGFHCVFARGPFVMLLRRKLPDAKIFVGFWTLTEVGAELRHALPATGADLVVASLRKAVEQIVDAARESAHHRPVAGDQQPDIGIPSVAG